jgi:GTPase
MDRTRNGRGAPTAGPRPPDSANGSQRTPRARQRALCIAALPDGDESSVRELGELLRTAGVAVVGTLVQRREQPHPNTYLGPGKVAEARRVAGECDANVVACDDELTPRQERNLESEVGLPVVDRTTVILDIFAAHAASAEGKLQVELAQLEYNLARMRGLWSHLERLGGGIGTRGPGESQIETDRRLARDRIAALRRRLQHVRGTRAVMRAERERAALPTIALAGYTNAGKSTLLNALTAAYGRGAGTGAERSGSAPQVEVRDRLFHTLDPTTRTLRIGGRPHLLTDTVGFIRKLPHQLVDAFGATLEETIRADLLLHVLDASAGHTPGSGWSGEMEAMRRAVEEVLQEIGADSNPRVLVLNKVDLLNEPARQELRLRHPDAVLVSGAGGEGLEDLAARIDRELRHTLCPLELLVPYANGASLAELHEVAGELARRDTPEGVRVRALVPARLASRYARFAVA